MNPLTERIVAAVGTVLLGKDDRIRLALACMLARGHLLIEDLPGMGKTTFAHALAAALGLSYKRVQFTSDLLPTDILGAHIFDPDTRRFNLHPGPIFTQVLLADEINRTSPKTQSALLEAMEEQQVSIDGKTFPLPDPFFVIATQNPLHQAGTYPLPESQLDRFLMRLSLGYPGPGTERRLLEGAEPREHLARMQPAVSPAEWARLQGEVSSIHASGSVLDYLQRLIDCSRHGGVCHWGLSPRAAVGLTRTARAWGLLHGRRHLVPEDIQAVFGPVVAHRLRGASSSSPADDIAGRILEQVDVLG